MHLTRDGYAFLGNAFAADLIRAYGAWRTDTGLSPSSIPVPVPASPSPAPVAPPTLDPIAHGE